MTMSFDGSAIKALLDGAVSKGAVHGIAAVVVDRSGLIFHHAAGEAGERTMFRNASMTKAVATTAASHLRQRIQHRAAARSETRRTKTKT
jgi:CubicO group peptidase (beta-lactamase class C family)